MYLKPTIGGRMFQIGDYAVCPGHGVGQVVDIEERSLGGETKTFYAIKITGNGMKVMVPTDSKTGIRSLADDKQISEIYQLLRQHNVELDTATWNRRYRDYSNKLKTGSLVEIAEVLRALFLLKGQKNLSFGEKKMLNKCRDLLVQEIALSEGGERSSIESKIESCFD